MKDLLNAITKKPACGCDTRFGTERELDMKPKEIDLNICINVKVRVTNDSDFAQKYFDAKVKTVQWIRGELLPAGEQLDISHGSGEVEIINLSSIRAEVV